MAKKIFEFCKKWGKKLALAGILFHGATQLNYWRNDIYNGISPSTQRQDFYDEFGIPLRGWSADIEESPKKLCEIAEVVSREKQDDGFDLKYLRVESKNYLKRNILDQLGDIATTGYSGWYFSNRIGLMNHADARTTHNDEIPRNEKIVAKLKLAEEYGVIPRGFFDYAEITKLYPRALGSIENGGGSKSAQDVIVKSENFLTKHPNSVYEGELRRYIGSLVESRAVLEACAKDERLKDIHNLRRNSIYATLEDLESLQKQENELLKQNKFYYEGHLKFAIKEYKKALNAGFKDKFNYRMTLSSLKRCYETLGEDNLAKIYEKAIDEHIARENNSDVKLSSRGVNDYLESNGVSLDRNEHRNLTDIAGGNK